MLLVSRLLQQNLLTMRAGTHLWRPSGVPVLPCLPAAFALPCHHGGNGDASFMWLDSSSDCLVEAVTAGGRGAQQEL